MVRRKPGALRESHRHPMPDTLCLKKILKEEAVVFRLQRAALQDASRNKD